MIIKAALGVRAGSQRVKNKNMRPFAGSSLLEIKVKQLRRIKGLDGIVVSSDSDEMLKIAADNGAETIKRDAYYASSTVSINETWEDMAKHIDADVIVYTTATNPLLCDETIEKMMDEYMRLPPEFDSLNSATPVKEFLWKDTKAINYDPRHMPKSQDLPNILALNFAVNILKRETMIKARSIIGFAPCLYPIDEIEATDIDNEIDFDFAEFMYKRRNDL